MPQNNNYDLVVIGGGPAGYAGAIRAGQLGKKTACIEFDKAGGTCLNWGCIPSKALLYAAETYDAMRNAETFGLSCGEITVDFEKVMFRSRQVVERMSKGIEFLFKKNKVDYFRGRGHISAPGVVEITAGKENGSSFSASNILIATGCKADVLPGLKVDGNKVMTSREALSIKELPGSIAIVGAGAVGVEFAYFLNAFGCRVTIVEMLPQLLPVEDTEISTTLLRSFKKQGINCCMDTKVENIDVGPNSVKLDLVKDDKATPLEVDSLLLAVGVTPNIEGLLSTELKPATERGFIKVDDKYQTSIKGIYAAGDIIGAPLLAHVGTFEAVQAVNGMFGHSLPELVKIFPSCTYCQPQVAGVGLTEAQAKKQGYDYQVGKSHFLASGKAVAVNHPEGFVKLILDKTNGEILGAHIIGADATELIAEYVLAMKNGITAEKIHNTIHAHPTLSEALAEAAGAASSNI